MTKKVISFLGKIECTPSKNPGYANVSNADTIKRETYEHDVGVIVAFSFARCQQH